MSADSYEAAAQQALLEVVQALAERPLEGCRPAEVEEFTGRSKTVVFRALKNLEIAGWAEQTAAGHWRLAPEATKVSERVRVAIAEAHRRYLEA